MRARRRSGAWAAGGATLLALAACAPDPPPAVVAVRAEGCPPLASEGVGTIVAAGEVLTAAHTVAGAERVTVAGEPAEVVALDAANDLALLRIADVRTAPLPRTDVTPGRGTRADAYVRRDGGIRRIDVIIVRPVVIATTDIHHETDVERQGFELAGPIEPGDSGAPLVVGGRMVAVVWARSTASPGRAYAVAAGTFSPAAGGDRCPPG